MLTGDAAHDDPYADLKVLIHWHAPPGPPPCVRHQVVVGPFYQNVVGPDGIVSLNVPFGSYDIRTIIDRLPPHQRPDVLLVAVDSTKTSLPTNLASLDCPKALIVGDTHHLEAPIRYVFACLLAESFDVLVADYDRQHLHFFWHADRARLAWIPCMWVRNFGLPFREERPDPAVFVGRTTHHVFRRQVLDAIQDARLPLDIVSGVSAEDAARRYGAAHVTLNCGLNGDLNMRVFETVGHGGFLLTDRLSPEAGLASLFTEGQEIAFYDSAAGAVAKLRFYLDRPEEALAMARRGYDRFVREHQHDLKMRQLLSTVLNDGRYSPPAWSDKRAERQAPDEPQGLLARILVYEHLQELHRIGGSLAVTVTAGVDARTLTDMVDLPRLRCTRLATQTDATAVLLARLGYAGRISVRSETPLADVVIATSAEIESGTAMPTVCDARAARVILLPPAEALDGATARLAAAGYRLMAREPVVFERTM